MEDFINFIKHIITAYDLVMMIVCLSFTMVFLILRLFKFASIFGLAFIIAFVIWLRGPMGQQVSERFQKKHPPTFDIPDDEETEKARESYKESLKEYRKALKEMKEAQEQ